MGYVSSKSLQDAGSSVYTEIFTDGVDYTSGTTTQLTASNPLPAANAVWVYFDGVIQHHSEYGVSGYSIIFTEAIPAETDRIEIQFNKQVNVGVPGENTITHSMMTANNISTLLRKNAIINGNFDIWQRDTSQTGGGYGSDDRWENGNSGTSKTHSRQTFTVGQTDVPNNPKYYSRTVVTSSAGTANFCAKWQKIEGVETFAGETVTISFWAKADAAKNIATEFLQNFGTGGGSTQVNAIGVTTFSLATTWQKYTATVSIPSITGKTIGGDANDSLQFQFWFDAGTNYDSRTNSLGQQSGTFDISQVQIEAGSDATDFERRTVSEEMNLCVRYYRQLQFPTYKTIGIGRGQGTTTMYTPPQPLSPPMRTAPSGNTSTSGNIQIKRISDNTALSSTENVSAIGIDASSFQFTMTYTHNSADETYRINTTATAWTATLDAEL